jgi:hypothetical protein
MSPHPVASGILPDVEGGIPAARSRVRILPAHRTSSVSTRSNSALKPAGLEARLHGRQDACRYIP